jgi:hypothetical protein
MGGNSDTFCARVVNLITYDLVDDQKLNLYLKFEVNTLRNKELIVKKLKNVNQKS